MGHGIEVTRHNLSASALWQQASWCDNGWVACRILPIAQVLEGASWAVAASACRMDRQTLRDWVHRYNADGVDGLADAPRSGRPTALSDAQMRELQELVVAGPDLARDGVVRWRCMDLRLVIKARFDVAVHERTVDKLLRQLELTRLQPRPPSSEEGRRGAGGRPTSQPRYTNARRAAELRLHFSAAPGCTARISMKAWEVINRGRRLGATTPGYRVPSSLYGAELGSSTCEPAPESFRHGSDELLEIARRLGRYEPVYVEHRQAMNQGPRCDGGRSDRRFVIGRY